MQPELAVVLEGTQAVTALSAVVVVVVTTKTLEAMAVQELTTRRLWGEVQVQAAAAVEAAVVIRRQLARLALAGCTAVAELVVA